MTASAEIISGSDWKTNHFIGSMAKRGVEARGRQVDVYAKEPESLCAWMLGSKLQIFLQNEKVVSAYEQVDYPVVVTTIDVNGLLFNRRLNKRPYQITTSRGIKDSRSKVLESSGLLQRNLRGRGGARSSAIVFQNVVGRGVIGNRENVTIMSPFVDTGLITLSAPLIKSLGNLDFLSYLQEWGESAKIRPLLNERSSAGIDFTVLPDYILGVVGSGRTDPGYWVSLMLPDGRKYVADRDGYDLAISKFLVPLLRGITDNNADKVANLAKAL